jgi:hypothetical protein
VHDHLFASATRDETWTLARGGITLLEEKYERGLARTHVARGGFEIEASDHFGAKEKDIADALDRSLAEPMDEMVAECDEGVPLRIRSIRESRYLRSDSVEKLSTTSALTITTAANRSVITTPQLLHQHLQLLLSLADAEEEVTDYRAVPMEWSNGTAAVLLHEAIGHPAQHGAGGTWPQWLSAADEPGSNPFGEMSVDDCGIPAQSVELNGARPLLPWRRTSYRDAPLRRMSNLVIRAHGVSALPPARRLIVRLVAGGHYDPLTDRVSLVVSSSEMVDGASRRVLAPFTVHESRSAIAEALLGSLGSPMVYPGVACFDEGQRVFAGSSAPPLITRAFGDS